MTASLNFMLEIKTMRQQSSCQPYVIAKVMLGKKQFIVLLSLESWNMMHQGTRTDLVSGIAEHQGGAQPKEA